MPKPSKKGELIEFLKNAKEEYSIRELARNTSLAPPTISIHVKNLEKEGKVKTRESEYGVAKLVTWKKKGVRIKG